MPRSARAAAGGVVYHVLNRANARMPLFEMDDDYALFEDVLSEAHQRVGMRTLGYCVMPDHWHLVLWPRGDGDMSQFVRWLTATHTQRRHARSGTAGTGHVYQGRFKSFPVQRRRRTTAERAAGVVQAEDPFWTVLGYVERNARRAGLVSRAEDWRWGSLWRRTCGGAESRSLLTDPSEGFPADWLARVNEQEGEDVLVRVRECIARGRPFGQAGWVKRTASRCGLTSTLRPRGRPRNTNKGS